MISQFPAVSDVRWRTATFVALLFSLQLGFVENARGQPQAEPPNIVLIFADDLGYGDIGAYGAVGISTPNIDQIANEGITLTDFYASPSCGLSRAMLLTGSYSPRVSLARNFTPSSPGGIHSDEVTIGEMLQDAGYITGMFGKWHLGDHYQFRPLRHGFDEFYGIPYSNNMWPFHPRTRQSSGEDPRLTDARNRALLTGFAGQDNLFPAGQGYPNLPLYDDDEIVEFNTDQAAFGSLFIDKAIAFIERNQDGPFFAYIALTAPHVPLHPSEMYTGTSARDLYGDTVQEVDADVGRVLEKLTELAIDQKTLVLFISDNGPWLEYGVDGGSAGGLSGGKGTQLEGGVRVPALVRWPGQLAADETLSEPMSIIDVLPTFAGLAGGSLPQGRTIDGLDIWPVLSGQQAVLQRPALFSFVEDDFSTVDLGAIRSGRWKLHVKTTGATVSAVALHDLTTDIRETTNLRASQGAVVSSLLALGQQIVADIRANQRPQGQVSLSGEPFSQKAGVGHLISIEAEHFHTRQARGGQNWEIISGSSYSSGGAIRALPNNGTSRNSGYEANSPHVAYRVVFETPGRYYVDVRGIGSSGNDDTVHVGLDGQAVTSGIGLTGFDDSYSWASTLIGNGGRSYVDVSSAGEYVIDMWMREDGVVIDKIVLTTDPAFQPLGKGPVESRQSYDGLSIPPVAVNDGPFAIDEGGAFNGQANVLDNDTEPRNDPKTAVLTAGPAYAASFSLRADGTFDYTHDGSETVLDVFRYTANDVDGASNEAAVTMQINPVNDLPAITLNGLANERVILGSAYNDPGATAEDAEDGDISADIVVGGDAVDQSTLGTYIISYNVADADGGNAIEVSRTVLVIAPAVPPPSVQRGGGGGLTGPLEVMLLCLLLVALHQRRCVDARRRAATETLSGG